MMIMNTVMVIIDYVEDGDGDDEDDNSDDTYLQQRMLSSCSR